MEDIVSLLASKHLAAPDSSRLSRSCRTLKSLLPFRIVASSIADSLVQAHGIEALFHLSQKFTVCNAAADSNVALAARLVFQKQLHQVKEALVFGVAAKHGLCQVLAVVLAERPSLDTKDGFILAAQHGQAKVCHMLLERQSRETILSALGVAVHFNHPEAVKEILKCCTQDDVNDAGGSRMLIVAATLGWVEVVRVLLDFGADSHRRSSSPLASAAAVGKIDVVRLLCERGADVFATEALVSAVSWGHINIVAFLLESGADVHGRDRQAMALAVRSGNEDLVGLLLDYGADPCVGKGKCFEIAREMGYFNIVNLLKTARQRRNQPV
ncbi:hypothetical protein HK104_000483 [Borealophlyctis nickersoniae]|nr:hypothetical protein HK104_000483 [Borealophlyctis nickersoniae]